MLAVKARLRTHAGQVSEPLSYNTARYAEGLPFLKI